MDSPGLGEGGFEPYLRAVRKHPGVVAVTVVVVLLGAWGWLLLQPVTYRATDGVLVTTAPFNDPTYQGTFVVVDTPADPVQAYLSAASMLDSPSASRLTAVELGAGWTPGKVASHVTVLPQGESDIVDVQATAPTAQVAMRLADTFTQTSLRILEAQFSHQAAHLLKVLHLSPKTLAQEPLIAQQVSALEAVRRGVDPTFGVLHSAAGTSVRTNDSSLRLFGLALLPAGVLGVAAALLWEAIAIRRRRAPGTVLAGDLGA